MKQHGDSLPPGLQHLIIEPITCKGDKFIRVICPKSVRHLDMELFPNVLHADLGSSSGQPGLQNDPPSGAYRDLDVEGIKGTAPRKRAEAFIRAFGLSIPLPIPHAVGLSILDLRGFPAYEWWANQYGEGGYPLELYRADLRTVFQARSAPANFGELYSSIAKVARRLELGIGVMAKLSDQDRGAYARSVLAHYRSSFSILERTLYLEEPSDAALDALGKLAAISRAFPPVQRKTKKEKSAPDYVEPEVELKKKTKRKASVSQIEIW